LRAESDFEERSEKPLLKLHFLYHELRPDESKYSYALKRDAFERQIDLFVRIRNAESPSLWPEVTFDDGHVSDYEYALPILQSQGMIARFFITVGWTGTRPGYMGWSELRSLHESGQMIGAHGWSHTLLTHCTQDILDEELRGARLLLEDKLGTAITTMSLPGGRFNLRVLDACRKAGYTQIYTSVPKAEREVSGFMVGRLNVRGDMSMDWIRNVLQPENGALRRLERQYRMKATAQRMLGDGLYERLWGVLNRSEPKSSSGEDYTG
jgi:peptidoglycan/xylan/chitin deacetylase (PgdA/CDA1 family)